jgi:coenzyme Q-binding protein COQ10
MPKLDFTRQIPYSADQMFDLVADMAAYPKFVPNCSGIEIDGGPGVAEVRMHIRYGPIADAYTSRVTLDREAKTIASRAIEGPFSHLESQWRFKTRAEGCLVEFDIDFALANPLLAALAEPAFADKQAEIIDAFMARANALYGPSMVSRTS